MTSMCNTLKNQVPYHCYQLDTLLYHLEGQYPVGLKERVLSCLSYNTLDLAEDII